MNKEILEYNNLQTGEDKKICEILCETINKNLTEAESKVWHGHPVWFLDGNPIVGYAKRKNDLQLLFWSGQSFNEPGLHNEGTFKASQVRYTSADEVNIEDLKKWLEKSKDIQWDYKNIVKRKGELLKLKGI